MWQRLLKLLQQAAEGDLMMMMMNQRINVLQVHTRYTTYNSINPGI